MLVPVRLVTLQIKECGVSEKAAPISSTFSGGQHSARSILRCIPHTPRLTKFFHKQGDDDLFGTCASSYSVVNAAIVSAYDFVAR